jgi:hypothetical protein
VLAMVLAMLAMVLAMVLAMLAMVLVMVLAMVLVMVLAMLAMLAMVLAMLAMVLVMVLATLLAMLPMLPMLPMLHQGYLCRWANLKIKYGRMARLVMRMESEMERATVGVALGTTMQVATCYLCPLLLASRESQRRSSALTSRRHSPLHLAILLVWHRIE